MEFDTANGRHNGFWVTKEHIKGVDVMAGSGLDEHPPDAKGPARP